jgi:hypothetical protein
LSCSLTSFDAVDTSLRSADISARLPSNFFFSSRSASVSVLSVFVSAWECERV